MTVHLQGMGWLGSALAFKLAAAGVPFTWNDTDAKYAAWRACTGLVFPAGDERSMTNLAHWRRWYAEEFLPAGTVRPAAYCFAHKNPPHEGKYPYTDLGWLRIAHQSAWSVDVPAIVTEARTRFASQRTKTAPPGVPMVIAHGFGPQLDSVMWGWSALARLDVPAEVTARLDGRTPAFYARAHRFLIVYAYPVPTKAGHWWIGSTIAHQAEPAHRDTAGYLQRWLGGFAKCYPQMNAPVVVTAPIEGWRPRPAKGDPQQVTEPAPGRLMLPALWHSGVRWAPQVIDQAAEWCATQC